jgi:hypothetical protein
MTPQICEKEQAVLAALQNGNLGGGLLVHLETCPLCSEMAMTVEVLRPEAARLEESLKPPDPAIIFRRAQQCAREEALARATLPIRITLACTAFVSILSAPWLVAYCMRLPWESLLLRPVYFLQRNLPDALPGSLVIGMAATLVCVALSSWFVLREE